jgi:thioredoxin-like negative regulator of GroEL
MTTRREQLEAKIAREYADKVVLVRFSAAWCQPCKAAKPVVEQLKQKHPSLHVIDVDTDADNALAEQFGVSSLPTFVSFKNGKYWSFITGRNAQVPGLAITIGNLF